LDELDSSKDMIIAAGQYKEEALYEELAKSFLAGVIGEPRTLEKAIEHELNISLPNFMRRINPLLAETMAKTISNPKLDALYAVWEDYAESIDSTVTEALTSTFGAFIANKRSYQEWYYGFTDQTEELLKYRAEYLAKDVDRIMESLGVSDVTAENYLAEYDKAVAASPTPEVINSWQALGDALVQSSEATKALAEAQVSNLDVIDAVKEKYLEMLDQAWLGQYSPLSLLEKAEYANRVAYKAAETGGQTAIEAAYTALEASAAAATRDEDISAAFRNYTNLVAAQAEDATRTDIVNEIRTTNEKLTELIDKTERLEDAIYAAG
jgi:hypothetical protein